MVRYSQTGMWLRCTGLDRNHVIIVGNYAFPIHGSEGYDHN